MTDESEELEVCPDPDCASSNIKRRMGGDLRISRPTDGHTYRCATCGNTFDDPDTRARESHGNRPPNGGQALLDADPDELLSDGGRDA